MDKLIDRLMIIGMILFLIAQMKCVAQLKQIDRDIEHIQTSLNVMDKRAYIYGNWDSVEEYQGAGMSRIKQIREGLQLKQTDVERATGIRVTEQSNLEKIATTYLVLQRASACLSITTRPLYGLLDDEENEFVTNIVASRKMGEKPKKKKIKKGIRRMTLDLPLRTCKAGLRAAESSLGMTQVQYIGYLLKESRLVLAHQDGKQDINTMEIVASD